MINHRISNTRNRQPGWGTSQGKGWLRRAQGALGFHRPGAEESQEWGKWPPTLLFPDAGGGA